jgi:iron complex outermembrane recepter protein
MAFAQQPGAATSAASGSDDLSDRKGGMTEVIVTAQKRQEVLREVPISISVLNGESLDRSTVEGMAEALSRVPAVATNVNLLSGGSLVTIRGVVASGTVQTGSSPVSYYLDSVPFGLVKTAVAPDSSAYDLERVEVLRGPQGTLYGTGGAGGVVRVLTRDANLDEFELKARTSAAGTQDGGETYRGDVALNVPIVEGKLAARAVVGYQDLGGWIDHPNRADANDGEVTNLRLKVNAEPIDGLTLGLSAWRSRADYGVAPFSDANQESLGVLDQSLENDYDVYGLRVGYEFPGFSLSSSTSYLDYANAGNLDMVPIGLANMPLGTTLSARIFSQEINLQSTSDGAWKWSAGAIYRDGQDRFRQTFAILPAPVDNTDQSESHAVFGELTRLLLNRRLELTLGLRYFEDDVTSRENVSFTGVPGTSLVESKQTFDATSPRAVVTWHATEQITTYASYAEGFRSGFNQAPRVVALFPSVGPVRPDTLKNYEIGAKSVFLGGRLSVETAVYYIDWQDVQQQLTIRVGNDFPIVNLNGESASGPGFDLAVTAEPIDNLSLGMSFSWNDMTMDADVFSGASLIFAKGDRLAYSPEYTAGASAEYAFPLGGGGLRGVVGAAANYTSKQVSQPRANPLYGGAMLIARASLGVSADRWSLTVFGDNLNNEEDSPIPNATYAGWDPRVRPRTLGVQFDFQF